MQIKIYTDGSSLGNPGPGGFAALIYDGANHIATVKGGDKETTNNRMEMSAVIGGLYYVKKNFPDVSTCAIYSDSSLITETMTKHWKRKKNLDLWEKLDTLCIHFANISWNWIRGHVGHKQNTEADRIAVSEAKKRQKLYERENRSHLRTTD